MRVLVGRARGPAVPVGADRRRVAAAAPDAPRRRSAARDGRDGRRSRRRRVRAARDPRRRAARHAPRAAGRERAGEVGADARRAAGRRASPRSCRRRRAAITPSGCSPRSACRSRSTARCVRVRAGAPEPFAARDPGRSVVGRVLRGRRADHARLRSHDRVAVAEPDPPRLRRRAAPHGCRHRDRADRGALRRAGRRPARPFERADGDDDRRRRDPERPGRGARARGRGRVRRRRDRGARRRGARRSRRATGSARCTRSCRSSGSRSRPAPTGW